MITMISPSDRGVTNQKYRVLRELSSVNAKELWRDKKTMFFVLLFPLMFLGLFAFIGTVTNTELEAPRVSIEGGDSSSSFIATAMQTSEVVIVGPSEANMVITQTAQGPTVTVNSTAKPDWRKVVEALGDSGIPPYEVAVLTSEGNPVLDPFRSSLPTLLMVGFLSLATLGTAVPVVALRGRGVLRLLGTTPLKRSVFILAQSPARFGIGLAQALFFCSIAGLLGYLAPPAIPRLAITCVIGLFMLFAIGYLIGSRARNVEVTTTVVSLMLPVALLFSGSMIPLQLLPEPIAMVAEYLPTTILSNALGADMVGIPAGINIYFAWSIMALTGGICAVLASILFRWNKGEEK